MKETTGLTHGQWQAQRELQDVGRLTEGGVKVARLRSNEHDELLIDLLVDCIGTEPGCPAVELEPWEKVTVSVPPDYPLHPPSVSTEHRRFARLPHVVWGTNICLYLSPNDWDPGRGMFGFTQRLLTWFRHVADGTITGPDLPWDPPITAASRADGLLVVHTDLPSHLEHDEAPWVAMAVVEPTGPIRFEVRHWLTASESLEVVELADESAFLAPLVALPEPVDFSYPTDLGELLEAMWQQGIDYELFWRLLVVARDTTLAMRPAAGAVTNPGLPLVLLGSPAPRHVIGGSRVAHLAAWLIDVVGIEYPSEDDPVNWMKAYDQRPRVTTRRDRSRPSGWLMGKQVLVLGCGGLGAPIAEFCARAGAGRIGLVDSGLVHPGILVRQPYYPDDIGAPKAKVLFGRLSGLSPDIDVWYEAIDAIELVAHVPGVLAADLIVDATASPSVAAALEKARWSVSDPWPPILSVMVGHWCELAAATLALPHASGAGADILRCLAVTASENELLSDLLDDFHPDPPRAEVFQPEPGCSDPTYVGSAADLASFAGHLLNEALIVLDADPHPAAPSRWATVLRSPTEAGPGAAPQRLSWPNDLITRDLDHDYEIRLDLEALAAIRSEVLRMTDERGPAVETGGLLLGQIDHASRVVWVSEAQGLPLGSEASAEGLTIDPAHARSAVKDRLVGSRRLVGFVGAWHTHPRGPAGPSVVDQSAMEQMATGNLSAALLMIVSGGASNQWQEWIAGRGLPTWYARLYFPQ